MIITAGVLEGLFRGFALEQAAAPQGVATDRLGRAREVHHHQTYRTTIHVDGGRHDVRQLAREIERIRSRRLDALSTTEATISDRRYDGDGRAIFVAPGFGLRGR